MIKIIQLLDYTRMWEYKLVIKLAFQWLSLLKPQLRVIFLEEFF